MANQVLTQIEELVAQVAALTERVTQLETQLQAKSSTKSESVEMTDDHARSVLFGDHAALKHKDAAEKLGLTYGQIYSCRLGYTFKAIHKEMKDAGKTNPWIK